MADSTQSILIFDDDEDVAFAAQLLLRRRYPHVASVHSVAQLQAHLQTSLARSVPDLILLDLNYTPGRIDGAEGMAVLAQLRNLPTPPAIIVLTAYADIPLAVQALKLGASDFITKPWDNARLLAAIEQALSLRASANVANIANSALTSDFLLGESAPMRELKALIARVAPTTANVMILGENGVGKELVARAVHAASLRSAQTFLAVDMGTLPEATFESELFGHRKGAFTDAKGERLGRFQAARGGSLFLDEIGNMPLALQSKLLTALERREVTPLGADAPQSIDVRVISATNLNEAKLFDTSVFRSDLLFRLNTIVLRVPALRSRPSDIPLLLDHYLAHYQQQYQRRAHPLAATVEAQLSNYPWPGNVRELRHACERAVIMAERTDYRFEDFALATATNKAAMPIDAVKAETENPVAERTAAPQNLAQLESAAVSAAMAQAQGNISACAKILGVSRAALYRKLEKYGL